MQLIGANVNAIKVGEDRELFKAGDGRSWHSESARAALLTIGKRLEAIVEETGYPAIIRPAFTLGGTGGGTAYNPEEFEEIAKNGLAASPVARRSWSRNRSWVGRNTSLR